MKINITNNVNYLAVSDTVHDDDDDDDYDHDNV